MLYKSGVKRVIATLILLIALFLISLLVYPPVGESLGLDPNPPQAARVDIQPSPTPTTIPAADSTVPKDEEESEETETDSTRVDVVIAVEGASTPEPEEDGTAASTGLRSHLDEDKATLKLVIANPGDVEITPRLEVPFVLDASGSLMSITSEVTSGDPIPAKGIGEYELLITFTDVKIGAGPYTGQVDIYVPDPSVEDKDEKINKSLAFTIIEQQAPDLSVGTWSNLKTRAVPFLTALLEVLAVIAVIVVVIYLYPTLKQAVYDDPGLLLDEVSAHDEDKDKPKVGKQVTALLQDELDRFRGAGGGESTTTLVTQSAQASFDFSSQAKENAYVKVILEVLEFIFKRNVIKVTGQTQRSAVKGAGITLSITDHRNGMIIDTQTFWELDYSGNGQLVFPASTGNFDPYLLLTKPAAAWIMYKVSKHLEQDYRPLGTSNWMSHAYFMSAMYMFGLASQPDVKDAKQRTLDLLYTALNHDPLNPAANINVSRFELEDVVASVKPAGTSGQLLQLQFDHIANKLRQVIECLQGDKLNQVEIDEKLLDNTLWVAAVYGLAVAYSLSARVKTEKVEDVPRSARDAQKLLNSLKSAIEKSQTGKDTSGCDEENPYLSAVKCLLGLIELDEKKNPRIDFDKEVAENIAMINYRVHYDLACYYSRAAEIVARHRGDTKEKFSVNDLCEKGFFYLSLGLRLPGDLSNYAQVDSDLDYLRRKDRKRFLKIVNRHVTKTVEPAKKGGTKARKGKVPAKTG